MIEKSRNSELNMFKEDPDYERIKSELNPLINGFYSLGKKNRKYIQFKQSLDDWNKRLVKTMQTIGTVESIQKLMIPLMKKEIKNNHKEVGKMGKLSKVSKVCFLPT